MKYLEHNSTHPHWNMAFDQYALEGIRCPEPLFFLWQNAPAVIIGLNQSPYAEVNLPFLQEKGIVLARRVTGGGAVYHDLGNLNYSIAGPSQQMEQAFELVPAALREMGVPAQRSGRNDILVDGRKCSGYAKRLWKDRMMIHGTLMWDVNLEDLTEALLVPGSKVEAKGIASVRSRVANLKDYLPQYGSVAAFREALRQILAAGDGAYPLGADSLAEVDRMAREKFGTWEWNFGHSPQSEHSASRRFACGTVQVHYTLKHGVLESVHFNGDFLGNKPVEELAQSLLGQPLEAISQLPVQEYFDKLTPGELLSLFQE